MKVEVKAKWISKGVYGNVKIFIDDHEYDSGKQSEQFGDWIFDCFHEPRGWVLQLGIKDDRYTLTINNIDFVEMPEAPERERAPLARSKITYKMDGAIK